MTARPLNPLLKLVLEIGPLLLFFISFRQGRTMLDLPAVNGLLAPLTGEAALAGDSGPLFLATAVFMVAILVSLAVSWRLTGRLPRMALMTAAVVALFGGLTLWLQDETFIKMKPTIVNALFALVLGAGLARGRLWLRDLMEGAMPLDEAGWRIFTRRWVGFFVAMAVLNEIVWRTQTTDTWVAVKTFGYLPLTFLFLAFQWPLLRRHAVEEG